MKKFLFTAIAVLIAPAIALAQFNISGIVSEKNTGKPLPGATVQLQGRTVATNNKGAYTFTHLKPGNYLLTASFIGFETVGQNVNLETNQTLDFSLSQNQFITEQVVISATRAQGNAATTYKNIDKTFIEQRNFGQDLPFILDNTPGVIVTSDAGAGVGYTGIRIRGSDATRVNVTINGIPYNDSESQGTFWVNMPDFASSVDNIQIQRGVGTSSNGAGSFGGSVNIQTNYISQQPFAELNNSAGSFNTVKNNLRLGSGLINKHFSFEGRLSRIKSDGYIDRGSSDLKSYFLSGAYQGKAGLLRMNVFSGSQTTYQAWNGIPEAKLRGDVTGIESYIARNYLSDADAENIRRSGNRTYNSFTYHDQTDNYWQTHYQLIYATRFSENLTFNTALHYTDGKGYFEEYKPGEKLAKYGLAPVVIGGTTITASNLVRRRWLDNDFYGFTYALNYTPSKIIGLTLAGGYNRYDGDHFGQVVYAQYGSNGDNDRHYYDNTGHKKDFNIFGKVTITPVEGLNIYTDLQVRTVSYNVLGTDKNRNNLNLSDKLNFFNPKLGLSYNLNETHNIYTSFSIANKEPNRDDYINLTPGITLQPERLNNLEVGYRLRNQTFNIGLNGYGMFYKDQLVVTGKVNDVGEYYRQNVSKSYRMGVELDATAYINNKLIFNLNAAFSKNKIRGIFTEFTDDYDNGGQMETAYNNPDISFSPNTVIGGELVYNPIKPFAIALQTKYVGRQYLDNTQNEMRKLNAYWINNLRLGYDLKINGIKNVNIGLLVNNIFNIRYESNGYTFGYLTGGSLVRENFYFAQAGTNVLLNLNLKF